MPYKYVILNSETDAVSLNNRITSDCIALKIWNDGITNNYCNIIKHPELSQWAVVVLDDYLGFFTQSEIQNSKELTPDWFVNNEDMP